VDGVDRLRWAILGTGKIAHIFAASLPLSQSGELVAVGSRTPAAADTFVRRHGNVRACGSYLEATNQVDVDAVYIATPHTTHAELIAQAARAGKHILCEKPLTVTALEARDAVDQARAAGIRLMEAFAYRCHPQTTHLLRLLSSGVIGQVRMVEAVFGYNAGPTPGNYLLRRDLAGGSILDVGCYPMSMCGLIAESGRPAEDGPAPSLLGMGEVCDEHGVDHRAFALVQFPDGPVAQIACAIDTALGGRLRIIGSDGDITLNDPWLPGRNGPSPTVLRNRSGETRYDLPPDTGDLYALEADAMARTISFGEPAPMTLEESVANMELLDTWRTAVNYKLPQDETTSGHRQRT
jgi:predicted dehydrogenase